MQSEIMDCLIRGNKLLIERTHCIIRGTELQSERTSCPIRGNELLTDCSIYLWLFLKIPMTQTLQGFRMNQMKITNNVYFQSCQLMFRGLIILAASTYTLSKRLEFSWEQMSHTMPPYFDIGQIKAK